MPVQSLQKATRGELQCKLHCKNTGPKLETKALLILKLCLRKLWVLANKRDFCLQSWQKIQSTYWQKNLDEKSLAGSATVCSNSPPIQRDRFSLAGRKMQGTVPEGSPRAVFFCFPPFQPYTFLSCKSFYQLSFQVSFSDKGLFHNPGIFRNRRAIDAVSLGWVCA